MSFIYSATGELTKRDVETFNNTVENFTETNPLNLIKKINKIITDAAKNATKDSEKLSGDKGAGYRGFQNKTKSGRTCMNWTAQSPHEHSINDEKFPNKGIGNHNYCRNPDGEPGIWCYTTDADKRWELCESLSNTDEDTDVVSVSKEDTDVVSVSKEDTDVVSVSKEDTDVVSVSTENVTGQKVTMEPSVKKTVSKIKSKKMPQLKDQDFLALDGNLVLNGTVKATNFIKSDGSEVKEVPILKNNYIIPKEIKYNADGTVMMKRVTVGKLKTDSLISENVTSKNLAVVGDMQFTGGNNWTLHTPDDKRRALYIAPSKEANKLEWEWSNQTVFNADGSVEIKKLKVKEQVDADSIKSRTKTEIIGPMHFYDKTTKGNDSDHYKIEKIRHSANNNELRVTLHDDANESMTIYGDSCRGGKCQDDSKAKLGHKFSADGTFHHNGTGKIKGNIKIGGHIIGNMPDTRNENKSPNEYRSKMGKGQIKEFKRSSTIGVTIPGNGFGVLTTTVPWSDTSGGNVFQDFEASYRGVRYVAKRNENNGTSWTPWVIMNDTGYRTSGLTSNTTNYSTTYNNFRYFKRNGIVHVQGLVRPGSNWGNIATLPTGFRPSKKLIFNLNNHAKTTRIDVDTNGIISRVAGGQDHNWISLDGISFPVDN